MTLSCEVSKSPVVAREEGRSIAATSHTDEVVATDRGGGGTVVDSRTPCGSDTAFMHVVAATVTGWVYIALPPLVV